MNAPEQNTDGGLGSAYERMLGYLKETFGGGRKESGPRIQDRLAAVRDRAVELDELSHEEAERISDYLRRDLEDAARFVADTGKELGDWLSMDASLIEDRLLQLFAGMVDETRLTLDTLALEAQAAGWHTGEVIGLGTLKCTACGQEMHFDKPGHIPPCPKCHGTEFERATR